MSASGPHPQLDKLTHELPRWDRAPWAFQGSCEPAGCSLRPTSPPRAAWYGAVAQARGCVGRFPARAELEGRLGKPTRLSNDADMHGLAVISGDGLELVLTLGTGLGTAVFLDGSPTPHLELALMPFQGVARSRTSSGTVLAVASGTAAGATRPRSGRDVRRASCTSTGSTSAAATREEAHGRVGHRAELVDNAAGILGGIKLWEL